MAPTGCVEGAPPGASRVACVDLPAFPLQILWRRHPDWRGRPAVVVAEDKPLAEVLWASQEARQLRILPGMRYAHALGLAVELRAGVIAAAEIAAAVDQVAAALRACSPEVEPAADEPGVFWIDGSGLGRLYRSASAWGRALCAAAAGCGFSGAATVGFTRFGTYGVARARPGEVVVFAADADERMAARQVPLATLGVDPRLRDALERLGVVTVGELVRLPGGGVLERFGGAAHRLYQRAAGERWDPLSPRPAPEALDEQVLLDDPEDDVDRLLFAIKGALDRLLARLARRHRSVAALFVEHKLYRLDGPPRLDCIRPAEPTLDARALLRLVKLRLEGQPLGAGATEVRLYAQDAPATRDQLHLFAQRPRRDLRAAGEAVARVRAELGDAAVVRAVLRDGHLPEARFGWEPMTVVVAPRPQAPPRVRPLVRRVMTRPQLLPPQESGVRDDGWLLSGLEHGAVTRVVGPYLLSGGWWAEPGREVRREYHFAETRRGDCLWVYFDARRRRWFLQGRVE